MPEDAFVVELSGPNMFLERAPLIDADACVTSRFDQKDLIRIRLKLQAHAHVIEVRAGICTCEARNCLVATEQYDVAGVRLSCELVLAAAIEPPRLLDSFATLLFIEPITRLYVLIKALQPLHALFLRI